MEMKFKEKNFKLFEKDQEKIYLLEGQNETREYSDLEEGNIKRPHKTPQFLLNDKNCSDKIINIAQVIFCCNKKKLLDTLKQDDLNVYYKLKEIALISYNEFNNNHEDSLKSLFILVLNCELTDNLQHVEWKGIGFQVKF